MVEQKMTRFTEQIFNTTASAHISDAELAKRLETSRQTVSQWRNGQTNPGPESVRRFVDKFGNQMTDEDVNSIVALAQLHFLSWIIDGPEPKPRQPVGRPRNPNRPLQVNKPSGKTMDNPVFARAVLNNIKLAQAKMHTPEADRKRAESIRKHLRQNDKSLEQHPNSTPSRN